jgi:hypothetical protein
MDDIRWTMKLSPRKTSPVKSPRKPLISLQHNIIRDEGNAPQDEEEDMDEGTECALLGTENLFSPVRHQSSPPPSGLSPLNCDSTVTPTSDLMIVTTVTTTETTPTVPHR